MSIIPFSDVIMKNTVPEIPNCNIIITSQNSLPNILISLNKIQIELKTAKKNYNDLNLLTKITVVTSLDNSNILQDVNQSSLNLLFNSKDVIIKPLETTIYIIDLYSDLKLPNINQEMVKKTHSSLLFLVYLIDKPLIFYLYSCLSGLYNIFDATMLLKDTNEVNSKFKGHVFKFADNNNTSSLINNLISTKNDFIINLNHPLVSEEYIKKKNYEKSFTNSYVARNSIVLGTNKYKQPILSLSIPLSSSSLSNNGDVKTFTRQVCNFAYSPSIMLKNDLPEEEGGWISREMVKNLIENGGDQNNHSNYYSSISSQGNHSDYYSSISSQGNHSDYYSPKLSQLLKNLLKVHKTSGDGVKSAIFTNYSDKYGINVIESCLRYLGFSVLSIVDNIYIDRIPNYDVILLRVVPQFPISVQYFHIFEQMYEMKEEIYDILKHMNFNVEIFRYISKISEKEAELRNTSMYSKSTNTPDYYDYLQLKTYYNDIDKSFTFFNNIATIIQL
jgi:hypothetical protein